MPAQFWESVLNSPSPTADGAALATSTTLTDVSPAPQLTLPANYVYPGQVFHIRAKGRFSTTATPTLLLGIYWGGVAGVALASNTITTPSGVTNLGWRLEADLVVRSVGSSGSILTVGDMLWGLTSTTTGQAFIPGSAPAAVTVDTTAAKAVTIGAQWGASSASNTLTCHQFVIEAMN